MKNQKNEGHAYVNTLPLTPNITKLTIVFVRNCIHACIRKVIKCNYIFLIIYLYIIYIIYKYIINF